MFKPGVVPWSYIRRGVWRVRILVQLLGWPFLLCLSQPLSVLLTVLGSGGRQLCCCRPS